MKILTTKGKERHHLFTMRNQHTLPKSFMQTIKMQYAQCRCLFSAFLVLMPTKKAFCTTLNLLLNDQYKQDYFFEIREGRRDYNT